MKMMVIRIVRLHIQWGRLGFAKHSKHIELSAIDSVERLGSDFKHK